jgi:hypothetical protein
VRASDDAVSSDDDCAETVIAFPEANTRLFDRYFHAVLKRSFSDSLVQLPPSSGVAQQPVSDPYREGNTPSGQKRGELATAAYPNALRASLHSGLPPVEGIATPQSTHFAARTFDNNQ